MSILRTVIWGTIIRINQYGEIIVSIKILLALFSLLFFLSFASAEDDSKKIQTTEKGIGVDWFAPKWLTAAAYAPVFEVRDTENKYGRYAKQTKTVTIRDLIKFHGHFCGGLVESAASSQGGL